MGRAKSEARDPRQLPKHQWTGDYKQWKFLTPMVWAPAFPLLRGITSRMQTPARMATLGTAILIANLHAFWLINNPDLSDEALGISR